MRSTATVFLMGIALFTIFVQIEGKAGKFACKDKPADDNDEASLKSAMDCVTDFVSKGSGNSTNCAAMVDDCIAKAAKAFPGCGGKSQASGKVGKMIKTGVDKVKGFACSGKMPSKEDFEKFKNQAKDMMKQGKDFIKNGMAEWKKKDRSGESYS